MQITLLKADSERCDDCRRPANYRVRLRNLSEVLMCDRCAVRLLSGLAGSIASAQARSAGSVAKRAGRRQASLLTASDEEDS
jgi:hypothetical protein